MNAILKAKSLGFSLVELMTAIVIMGILAAVAIPSFQTWIINSQTRNAAESITNGLQRARSESVARNTNVQLVLGANSSWVVSVVNNGTVIQSRLSSEGSTRVTRTVLPAGATSITYNNFGLVVANADASASLTQVDLTAAGGTQNLRVTIGAGGNARMCDPNMAAGSPRAC